MLSELTQERVRDLFDYHESGGLVRKSNGRLLIQTPGNPHHKQIRVGNDRVFLLSRTIFIWHHGWLPEDVDHFPDRSTWNNRIENLRASTHEQNARNRRLPINNRTGFKGVQARRGKFSAQIGANGKLTHLGTFDVAEEAARAYDDAARRLHGEFAEVNFP
jgi:hypothetical protein